MIAAEKIVRSGLCLGCGLCASLCPSLAMQETPQGYLEPQREVLHSAPKDEEADRAIAHACPAVRQRSNLAMHDAFGRVWGPARGYYTAHSTDPELRFLASSGGALSGICVDLLESGSVSAVLQVGEDPDRPLRNRARLSRDRAEVLACAGSRYAPASPLELLLPALQSGETLAVVGRPCDISAVRRFLQIRPQYARQVRCLLSFFCAGQSSYRATQQLLERLGCEPDRVSSISYRGRGWPGLATARLVDGTSRSCGYDESWGQVLGRSLHFRCNLCPDGIGWFADVVCADAWTIESDRPVFREMPGRSLLVGRTVVGQEVILSAVARGAISAEPFDEKTLPIVQPYQSQRRTLCGARLCGAATAGVFLSVSGLYQWRNLARQPVRQVLSNFRGSWRRARRWQADRRAAEAR